MRLIKASNGKTKLNISKKEWQQIGRTAGWGIDTLKNETTEQLTTRMTAIIRASLKGRPHDLNNVDIRVVIDRENNITKVTLSIKCPERYIQPRIAKIERMLENCNIMIRNIKNICKVEKVNIIVNCPDGTIRERTY